MEEKIGGGGMMPPFDLPIDKKSEILYNVLSLYLRKVKTHMDSCSSGDDGNPNNLFLFLRGIPAPIFRE